jgi:flagellar protein FlbD
MIRLTRLNNTLLAVNSDLIKFVEESPDTVITLVNGEKVLVLETMNEILDRILKFRRSILQDISPAENPSSVISPATYQEEKTDEQGGN